MVCSGFSFHFFIGYEHLPIKHFFFDYRSSCSLFFLVDLVGALVHHISRMMANEASTRVPKIFKFLGQYTFKLFRWCSDFTWCGDLHFSDMWSISKAAVDMMGSFTDDKLVSTLDSYGHLINCIIETYIRSNNLLNIVM